MTLGRLEPKLTTTGRWQQPRASESYLLYEARIKLVADAADILEVV